MASPAAVEKLTDQLQKLELLGLDKYPKAWPKINPVDVYRSHLTSKIARILSDARLAIDPEIIYDRLQWTAKLDQGDLALPFMALVPMYKGPEESWYALFPAKDLLNAVPEDKLAAALASDEFVKTLPEKVAQEAFSLELLQPLPPAKIARLVSEESIRARLSESTLQALLTEEVLKLAHSLPQDLVEKARAGQAGAPAAAKADSAASPAPEAPAGDKKAGGKADKADKKKKGGKKGGNELAEAKVRELANLLMSKWGEDELVEQPSSIGTHLPFFFKAGPLAQTTIKMVRGMGSEYGFNKTSGLKDPANPAAGKKRILVEFSSPNIAKPFHAGHLRSTIIGGFLSNLYQGAGWDVKRINYLGDWGKQYGVLAVGFKRYGDEEKLQKDPINHLFEVYVKINQDITAEEEKAKQLDEEGKKEEAQALRDESLDEQARRYFKAMTERDADAIAQWQRFRDLSIVRYKETYARLNIWFDEYSGESQVSDADMAQAIDNLLQMNIAEESQGALIVDFAKHCPPKEAKQLGKVIVRRRDGTALYLTRDISELMNREKKYESPEKIIYVIASAQSQHTAQFFKIVELLGHKAISDKSQHISFGLVLGMSTRKGTVKFLDDILRDVGDFMHDVMRKNEDKYAQVENPEQVADILGITSVMVQDMSGSRDNNYTFNMERMTSFEGNTGPYLQYAHARLCSITRKAALSEEDLASADLSLLKEQHAINIIRELAKWTDKVQNTMTTLEPTTILEALFDMTHELSSSYDHLKVVGSEPELMKARMALYDAARIVLNNGMRLLGLSPVERM